MKIILLRGKAFYKSPPPYTPTKTIIKIFEKEYERKLFLKVFSHEKPKYQAFKKRRDFEVKSRSAKASLYSVQQSEQHAKKMKSQKN